ncbi:small integral membrane protein 15-like [Stylophora pistillata]|uniref:Small integral membrane protein 15 n=1 Tax=Stylophora pistillata TaxID=50429 RepID=A0A2B4SC96_STYPI|nr:small integral membrane protein 15-like [Stylophora pistillata]PFX26065.1 Small integral membrane protein 15 [Stylophora pistillata]
MAENSVEKGPWKETLDSFVQYVALNPKEFLFYVFLIMTPLMAISGYLSLKLAKHIEKNEKEKKKKATRQSNMAKARRRAKAD